MEQKKRTRNERYNNSQVINITGNRVKEKRKKMSIHDAYNKMETLMNTKNDLTRIRESLREQRLKLPPIANLYQT